MSKLERLIADLCPNGVEYFPLEKLAKCAKGTQLNKHELLEEGYPVINGGINPSGFWGTYNFPENRITISQGGASAGYVNWQKTKFWAGAHCYVIIEERENINYRFLYHVIKNYEKTLTECQYGAGIPALGAKTVNALKIPVPPLDVQNEIVRMLDVFAELSVALTAELEARRRQYEFYRRFLIESQDGPLVRLDDICDVFTGGEAPNRVSEKPDESTGCVFPIWANGRDVYGYTDSYKIASNAVCISSIGANTGAVFYHEGKFTPIVRLKVLVPKDEKVDVRYLFHAVSLIDFKGRKVSSVPNMNAGEVKNKQIKLPSIDEQRRIANVLDAFDSLCTDPISGLPGEIITRTKQYECYRDKLLTFEEISL